MLNVTSKKMVYTFDTPDEHYSHPGDAARGDYLIVPVENSDNSQSYIHFYDLSSMTDVMQPAFLPFNIARGSSGAGAAGITNYTDNQTEIISWLPTTTAKWISQVEGSNNFIPLSTTHW